MLRTIIIPENTNINLLIPKDYIGKRIEVLLYAVDELWENIPEITPVKRKPSDFVGCISKETAQVMLYHIEESRKECERDI
jgi:hypothetical protein